MDSVIPYAVGDVVEVSDDTHEWWHAVIVGVNSHLRDVYKVLSVLGAFSSHIAYLTGAIHWHWQMDGHL